MGTDNLFIEDQWKDGGNRKLQLYVEGSKTPDGVFSQRLAGDIQGRLQLNASIAGTLVNTFAPLLLNTVMMVFYLVLMLKQSALLTIIGIIAMVLNIGLSRMISEKRINIARVQMRDDGKLMSTTMSGIAMIETSHEPPALLVVRDFPYHWRAKNQTVRSRKESICKMAYDLFQMGRAYL